MAYVPEKDRHYILGTTLYNLVDDIVETSRRCQRSANPQSNSLETYR
ncbi:hypothetical protein FHS27_005102 [Rhodopirellula rubra]|uniref:Uncharacterized protein n=1 Tax=Aporhodopirellula rubra TaxID=980271 RepID=A0A7W5E3P1_9BACT|nr:hypothetical protein [Aporhodopirellula rubra]